MIQETFYGNNDESFNEYRQFLEAIGNGDIELVKLFMRNTLGQSVPNGVDPSMNYNEPLLNALIRSHFDIADLLLQSGVDPNFNQGCIIRDILDFGDLEVLEHYFSLPGFKPSPWAQSIMIQYGL